MTPVDCEEQIQKKKEWRVETNGKGWREQGQQEEESGGNGVEQSQVSSISARLIARRKERGKIQSKNKNHTKKRGGCMNTIGKDGYI